MNSILREFALGNLNTPPQTVGDNPKLAKAMKISAEAEKKLQSMIDGEALATLEQFANAQLDVVALSTIDNFIHGYKLGVLMTLEVFSDSKGLIVGGWSE